MEWFFEYIAYLITTTNVIGDQDYFENTYLVNSVILPNDSESKKEDNTKDNDPRKGTG